MLLLPSILFCFHQVGYYKKLQGSQTQNIEAKRKEMRLVTIRNYKGLKQALLLAMHSLWLVTIRNYKGLKQ